MESFYEWIVGLQESTANGGGGLARDKTSQTRSDLFSPQVASALGEEVETANGKFWWYKTPQGYLVVLSLYLKDYVIVARNIRQFYAERGTADNDFRFIKTYEKVAWGARAENASDFGLAYYSTPPIWAEECVNEMKNIGVDHD